MGEVPKAPVPPADWGKWGKDHIERNYDDYLVREIRLNGQLIMSWVRLADHQQVDHKGEWDLSDSLRLAGEAVSVFDIHPEKENTLIHSGSICSLCARPFTPWIGYDGKPWFSHRCNDCCKAVENSGRRAEREDAQRKRAAARLSAAQRQFKRRRQCPTCHQQVAK